MPTYEQHVTGVLAAFNAGRKVAWSHDALPDVLPPGYITVQVSRRFGGVQRGSGERDLRLMRVTARAIGQTLSQAYQMWDVIDSLEDLPFVIAGQFTTPVEFETDDDVIEADRGWYSGSKSLSYAI